MSAVNGLAIGFLGGRFFHYIFVFIIIFAITYVSEQQDLIGPGIFQSAMICLVLPLILSVIFKHKVFSRGLRSLLFIAYRNIMIVFGLAFIGFGYLQTKNSELARPYHEEELAVINGLPAALREMVLTLSPAQMMMVMGTTIMLPGIAMLLYGKSVEKRYGKSVYDRDVAVVRDGINQSRL